MIPGWRGLLSELCDLPDLPVGQFRITKLGDGPDRRVSRDGVERFDFAGMAIEWARPLRATFLEGADGRLLGIALGHAFVLDTAEPLSSKHVSGFTGATYAAEDFERLYEGLFGTFILIVSIAGKFHLYPDAGAMLSVVYSPELGRVGATAGAILSPEDYERRFLARLYKQLDVKNEGWFPAGLTAHRGVERLYCSHRLDLETLSATRFWPVAVPMRSDNAAEALGRVRSVVRDSLKLVCDNFRAALALTGGVDTRVLACLTEGFRDRVQTFIVDGGAPDTRRDIHLGRKVAQVLGLPYRVLAPADDPASEARWRFRCGDAVGGGNARLHSGLRTLIDEGVEAAIDGIGAETARCLLWRDFDTPDRIPGAYMLTQRLGLRSADEVTEAVQRWLDGLPRGDAFFVLDMAELELRFSAWAYAQSYVDPPLLHFSPFVSRRSLNAMLALPVDLMRKGFGKEIVAEIEPALAGIPYNKWGDHRDWITGIARALREPRLVSKKIRKYLAA